MRLIDAEETETKLLEEAKKYRNGMELGLVRAVYVIRDDVSVVEGRHGYWIGKPLAGYCTVRCSYCRVSFEGNSGRWKYCPNCGAKMDGVNDG